MATTVVWLREDLRLTDHPALAAAIGRDGPVVLAYVLDSSRPFSPGGASAWWLHHSLAALGEAVSRRGGQLVLRQGDTEACLRDIVEDSGADALYFSRGYSSDDALIERQLKEWGDGAGIAIRRYPGRLLFEPEKIRNKSGDPFKVFTPFWKAFLAAPPPVPPVEAPVRLPAAKRLASVSLDEFQLLPTKPDWASGLRAAWVPGEDAAHERLEAFLDESAADYASLRDTPGMPGTSRLSPYLHFGEISPRQIWHAASSRRVSGREKGIDAFLRELGWRDFCHHLLVLFPELPAEPFRPEFAQFPWLDNPQHLRAWQRGQTGVPIVDAGMRELWETGWMHNRVRMIAASYLVKNLLIPWQQGEAWFWDTLVDADLANNSAGWQWVAGSGADAAPYFRIFNPVRQGERFDGDGSYVRRWIPELAKLPDALLHKPWEASATVLEEAGVTLGLDYPEPLVDLSATRGRALGAYDKIRKNRS